jgi:hypothetical protein
MIRKHDPAKDRKEAFKLMVPVLKDFTKTLYDPDLTKFKTINRKLINSSATVVFTLPSWDPILLPSVLELLGSIHAIPVRIQLCHPSGYDQSQHEIG